MSETKEQLICVICKKPIPIKTFPNGHTWELGNNALPIAEGRCCDACNDTKVVPVRIAMALTQDKDTTA